MELLFDVLGLNFNAAVDTARRLAFQLQMFGLENCVPGGNSVITWFAAYDVFQPVLKINSG